MQNEFIDTVNKAGKQAFDAAQEVSALNASTFETVLEKQLQFANQMMALNAKQAKIIAEYKDAPSAFEAQSTLVQEIGEQVAGNTRDIAELLNKTRTAYDKLFQKSLKDSAEAMKKAQSGIKRPA